MIGDWVKNVDFLLLAFIWGNNRFFASVSRYIRFLKNYKALKNVHIAKYITKQFSKTAKFDKILAIKEDKVTK